MSSMAWQPFAALGGSFEFNGRLAATASLIYACIPPIGRKAGTAIA
jgi:hypothetical protein